MSFIIIPVSLVVAVEASAALAGVADSPPLTEDSQRSKEAGSDPAVVLQTQIYALTEKQSNEVTKKQHLLINDLSDNNLISRQIINEQQLMLLTFAPNTVFILFLGLSISNIVSR